MNGMRPLTAPEVEIPGAHAMAHPRPFFAEITVTEAHLSRGVPHVNNAEYVRWIDRVAELHLESLGFHRAAMLGEERAWFVARHEIEYRAETWLGERLLLATWVHSIRRTTSRRETRILRGEEGKLIISASTLWAYVDLATRRPTRVPEAMRSVFEPLETGEER